MIDEWRNGRHVVYRLHAHIVLVLKYRRKVMTPRVTSELSAAFSEVCEHFETTLDAFETDQDHAHLLVSYLPKVALSRLVMSLKTNSSRRIRAKGWPEVARALWGEHFWSPSYAVVSCGGAPLQVIKTYIEDQQSPNHKPGYPKGRPRRRNVTEVA